MTLCANQDETGLEHRQVAILDAAQEVFTVDENIQPLIQLLYDNEICTFNSCEDNQGGRIWIEFGLFDWLAIVKEAYKLYRHSVHAFYDFVLVDCEVKLQPEDDGRLSESNPDIWIEGDEVVWSASVRFPRSKSKPLKQ
jgi:hypothetical protein